MSKEIYKKLAESAEISSHIACGINSILNAHEIYILLACKELGIPENEAGAIFNRMLKSIGIQRITKIKRNLNA